MRVLQQVAAPVLIALMGSVAGGQAVADSKLIPGYVVGASGKIVVNGQGNCLRSGMWKPEMVVKECDPELWAKMHPAEPAPPPAPAPKLESTLVTDTLDAQALFDFGKDTLRADAEDSLNAIARKIDSYKFVHRVLIAGFTDRIGSDKFNKDLSERRAAAVVKYLRDHTEIPDNKFNPLGMGKAAPVVTCPNETGRALIQCLQPNRRVEVEIVADREEMR